MNNTRDSHKFDSNKIPLGGLIEDHRVSFDLLGMVRNYSVTKYILGSGWRTVKDNDQRSINSVFRHLGNPFGRDSESGLPHLAHGIVQMMLASEYKRDRANIDSGIDPMHEIYGQEAYQNLKQRQEKQIEHWQETWKEQKRLILDGEPLLTPELFTDYRLTIDEMAKAYQVLKEQEPRLQDFDFCRKQFFQTYKDRLVKPIYKQTGIPSDIAAVTMALHCSEIKYGQKNILEFIQS